MFEMLDRQTTPTGSQKMIIAAATIGNTLEFFDYLLIGFVLAFLTGSWKLTFGQGADRRIEQPPEARQALPPIPTAFLYPGCWLPMAGVVYCFSGLESKGKSIGRIDRELATA